MKHILTFIAVVLLHVSAAAAEWTVVSTSATAFEPEEQTSKVPDDFWLHITLRNDSKVVQYIQGLRPGWFMVEAFVRPAKSGIWERQNIGVDQKLEWIAIKPGEEIKLTRRQAVSDIGLPMMLTFSRSFSTGDHTGTIVLLDQFTVPAPPKKP
ncbi:MAG: hypothetical protein IAE97_14150 [Chthoniobacterales bacterium]|nr:hypothetical protein [Chthoniobacterales bacterium]